MSPTPRSTHGSGTPEDAGGQDTGGDGTAPAGGGPRLVRCQVLSLRQQDFGEAARALGASKFRIMLRHLVPNTMAPIIVATTLAVGGFILGESALSYLGLGIQPPTPSWGNMLHRGREYVLNASWLALFPGVLIFITGLGL